MSIINNLYNIISVIVAIVGAAFMYRFAVEYRFKTIVTVLLCLLAAMIASNVWPFAALVIGVILLAKRTNILHK